jgi:hypothetical protein
MRLKKSKNAAEEELVMLINESYQILNFLYEDLHQKSENGTFDSERDYQLYESMFVEWRNKVYSGLDSIFPTSLEVHTFARTRVYVMSRQGAEQKFVDQENRLLTYIEALKRIRDVDLKNYTDLPLQTRLYLQDIDSFHQVRDVNPEMVKHHLNDGYLDMAEDTIQMALEQILNVPFHKKDWGGEINDLYTANVQVFGANTATAFLLKGNGLKKQEMQISDCGKNGDQLLRLFDSPAQLFIVQFVGNVSDNLIRDVEAKVEWRRDRGKPTWFCIMNGQDTAMLLHAYGKL